MSPAAASSACRTASEQPAHASPLTRREWPCSAAISIGRPAAKAHLRMTPSCDAVSTCRTSSQYAIARIADGCSDGSWCSSAPSLGVISREALQCTLSNAFFGTTISKGMGLGRAGPFAVPAALVTQIMEEEILPKTSSKFRGYVLSGFPSTADEASEFFLEDCNFTAEEGGGGSAAHPSAHGGDEEEEEERPDSESEEDEEGEKGSDGGKQSRGDGGSTEGSKAEADEEHKLAAVASAARIAWLRTASPNASRMRSANPDCAMRSSKFKAKARQAHLAPLAPPPLRSDPPALHPTTNDRPARPVVSTSIAVHARRLA